MNPIDINNPTEIIQQQTHDPAGQRMGRIYGDTAEMLRMHNAYKPNIGGKYDLNRIRRKRGEYEFRQLQTAMQREQQKYCDENSLSILDFQVKFGEEPEILEQIYERAFNSLPKQCRTILGVSIKK
jgi:hypothetical protein